MGNSNSVCTTISCVSQGKTTPFNHSMQNTSSPFVSKVWLMTRQSLENTKSFLHVYTSHLNSNRQHLRKARFYQKLNIEQIPATNTEREKQVQDINTENMLSATNTEKRNRYKTSTQKIYCQPPTQKRETGKRHQHRKHL